MCLVTNQKEPKIAEQDITVYKLVNSDRRPIYYGSFIYEEEILYKTEIERVTGREAYDEMDIQWLDYNYPGWHLGKWGEILITIGPGFHSFSTLKRADNEYCDILYRIIIRCTIPKGAEYYVNGSGLMVSNQIITHEQVKI